MSSLFKKIHIELDPTSIVFGNKRNFKSKYSLVWSESAFVYAFDAKNTLHFLLSCVTEISLFGCCLVFIRERDRKKERTTYRGMWMNLEMMNGIGV